MKDSRYHVGSSTVYVSISETTQVLKPYTNINKSGYITYHNNIVQENRSGWYYNGWYRGDKECSIGRSIVYPGLIAQLNVGNYDQYLTPLGSPSRGYYLISEAENYCVSKTGNKLLGDLNEAKFSAAVFYAEAHKTFKMLHKTAKRLNSLFKWFKGGGYKTLNLKSKVGNGGDLANLWLEYKYGWTPLYSEIYQAMINIMRPDLNHFIVRAHTSYTTETHLTHESNNIVNDERWEVQCGCTIKADLKISNGVLFNVQQLGLENPLEVLWETIPFSFVADWFIPISNYLSMLTAMQGMEKIGGSTTIGSQTWAYRSIRGGYDYDRVYNTNYRDSKVVYRRTNRQLVVPSYPSLLVNNPFTSVKGSAEKAATSVSLLRQVLSTSRR